MKRTFFLCQLILLQIALFAQYDAGITAIVSPLGNTCEKTDTVKVRLKNFGSQTLDSIRIDWSVNTVTQPSFYWTGTLVSGDSAVVKIGTMYFVGLTNYVIYASTYMPNGQTDANPLNNGKQSAVIVFYSIPTPSFNLPTSVCANDTVTVSYTGNATTAATYSWNFSGANIVSGTGQGPYKIIWNIDGLKTVSLQVTENGCQSVLSTQPVYVMPNSAQIAAIGSTTTCSGDSVILYTNTGIGFSYQWFRNDTAIVGATFPYIAAKLSGNYKVEITNSSSCTAVSNIIYIQVFPALNSYFQATPSVCKSTPALITYTGNADTTATFIWNFDGGNILSGTGQGPYQIAWNSAGIKNISLKVVKGPCTSFITYQTVHVMEVTASVTPLGSTTFCQGDSVTLFASSGPYQTYQWKKNGIDIPQTTLSYLYVKTSGSYSVLITNSQTNCSSISSNINVIVNPSDFPLAFTANPTTFTNSPFITQFTNNTPSPTQYYFTWNFGDGNSSNLVNVQHTYTYNGVYTVSLFAQNVNTGCKDTLIKPAYISCSGGPIDPCTLTVSITPAGQSTICQGDSILLTANSTTGAVFQWLLNGVLISGLNAQSFYAKNSGQYRVIATDAICSKTSSPFTLNYFPGVNPVIQANGYITPCSHDSMELYVTTFYNSYLWSSGQTTQNIWVKNSGLYTVEVKDVNGCNRQSQPYMVNAALVPPPPLCIVTVDSLSHNVVVWEKPNTNLIDSFCIYRETYIAGKYQKLATLAFNDFSAWTDLGSNPMQQAYRYRITAIDTCGVESAPGDFHKTIHLQINKGLNNSWNLIWDNYIGFAYGSIAIYRGSDSLTLTLLTQIQSNNNSYTDLNPPTGVLWYQLEITNPAGCNPTKAMNYNSSRSNQASNMAFIQNIQMVDRNTFKPKVIPNPNNGFFTLEFYSVSHNHTTSIKMISLLGSVVYEKTIQVTEGINRCDIHSEFLPKGIYTLFIQGENLQQTTRLIVQ